jgi:DNA repair protein RecN (Recombination protein N)
VLHELRVENLLLIERAELRLAPGLNVLTGETGAGKTVLAHALDLLLGGRARAGIVRPGAPEAWVEGVFARPAHLPPEVADRLPEGDDELVLARRVGADGRTRAYVGGRAASLPELRAVAEGLVGFSGQHEHRRLTLPSAQLDLLDAFCGPDQAARRAACAAAHAEVRAAAAALEERRERAAGRERELDLLAWELAEIEALDPSEEEEAELLAERERLRHLEGLRLGAAAGAEALSPADGAGGLASGLAGAEASLDAVAGVDPALDALAERLRALRYEAEDLAAELRRYGEGVEAAPGRLEEVEGRLDALARLARKHGGSLAGALAHAEDCRARRAELEGAEAALQEAEARLAEATSRRDALVAELRAARARAAPALAERVRPLLAELAMPGSAFEVALHPREEPGPTGADAVELLLAPNPGVPPAPLRDAASGGELSRTLLALLSVGAAAAPDTLVFDEIDAGIGGHTAHAVGARLRALAEGRQVLSITHLPQVASLAARHFRIAKDVGAEPARTSVTELAADDVVDELARMLGAEAADTAARRHAEELLRAA